MSDRQAVQLDGVRAHFVGIGGCGMCGLARISRAMGAVCSGSDRSGGPVVDALMAEGFDVVLEQSASSVPDPCELVVASAAIGPDHPELAEARRRGLTVLKYAELLGRLMVGRTGVAIAGTHGKSTTTAMLAHALIEADCDPTFIVGATCEQIGGGSRVGRPDLLVAEACEFDRSFHNFHPTLAAVLNVEEDHLDVYGSLDGVVEAFNEFAHLVAPGPEGLLLIGHDSAHRTAVTAGVTCRVKTIGFAPEADYVVTAEPRGERQRVTLSRADGPAVAFDLAMPGEHMAHNAAAAAALALDLDADPRKVGAALSDFRGLDRRMQHLGEVGGVTIIDDYGHHPTEIATTLRALRKRFLPGQPGHGGDSSSGPDRDPGRLICVFQPHQHSRTRFLLDQFASSFGEADMVIVPHIYFVRDSEADRRAVSAADLVDKLRHRGVDAEHIDSFDDIVVRLRQIARPGDLVVVMGAGPVWQVAHRLART